MTDTNAEWVYVVAPVCHHCKSTGYVQVKKEDLAKYNKGEHLIQDCFPYLDIDTREQLKSGIHAKCWIEMFGEEE